jgi:hypothetical protein
MGQGSLVNEQIEAAARFLREFEKYALVQAAFWLKESDSENWFLYVASDQITDDNFDLAYGEVARITRALQDPWFDPFQVKVIGIDDPLAQAALALSMRFPGRTSIPIGNTTFGRRCIDAGYIYAPPATATA